MTAPMTNVDMFVMLVVSVVFPILAVYSMVKMHRIASKVTRQNRKEDAE